MSATSAAQATSSSGYNNAAFWERFWRTGGLQFVLLFIVISLISGSQPPIGASPEALDAFYHGTRTRVLLGAMFAGLNLLNLLWFAAALRATLVSEGLEGWATASTAGSAVFGALYLLHSAVSAALAYSIAGSGNASFASGLHTLSWALLVLISFPQTMLIMSGVFGLWRAGLISNSLFTAGVGVVVLGVLGGTTWLTGLWAPDGAYTRFVSPALLLIWVVVVSRVLLTRSPTTRSGW